jgi:zinc protease
MQMGSLESVGLSWKLLDEYVDQINAVTAEQVQAVARKYLVDTGLTVAELVPDKAALNNGNNVGPAAAGGTHGH